MSGQLHCFPRRLSLSAPPHPHPHPTHIWYIYYRVYSHTVCRQLTKGHIIVSTSAESLLKHSNLRKLIAFNVAVILFHGRGIRLLVVGLNVKLQVVDEATGSKKFFPPAWKWVKQGLTCGPFQPQPIAYADLHSQPVPCCFWRTTNTQSSLMTAHQVSGLWLSFT